MRRLLLRKTVKKKDVPKTKENVMYHITFSVQSYIVDQFAKIEKIVTSSGSGKRVTDWVKDKQNHRGRSVKPTISRNYVKYIYYILYPRVGTPPWTSVCRASLQWTYLVAGVWRRYECIGSVDPRSSLSTWLPRFQTSSPIRLENQSVNKYTEKEVNANFHSRIINKKSRAYFWPIQYTEEQKIHK